MFGAETLSRKYGDTPPEDWDLALDSLTGYELQRGIKRLINSGLQNLPSLPQFLKFCRDVGGTGDYDGDDWGHIPPPQLTHFEGDKWDIASNFHFFRIVFEAKGRFKPGELDSLLRFKHAWAQDCREADKGDGVPVSLQKQWWADCMARGRAAVAA